MTDQQTGPDEATRQTIFADLIGKQDRGYSVAASRALIGKLRHLTLAAVKAIENEGVANDWPPLGE